MSRIYSKLITFILEHEGDNWFNAREFAEKYSFNYHTTRKYLEELADTGYLQRMKQGKITYYRLVNPHRLSELEKELARKDMLKTYREEIERLRKEIRKLRKMLSQYENLLDEETLRKTPEEPIVNTAETGDKSLVEVIMDLLYEKYCTKPIIRIKSQKINE